MVILDSSGLGKENKQGGSKKDVSQNSHVSKKVADPVRTLTVGGVFDMRLQIVLQGPAKTPPPN